VSHTTAVVFAPDGQAVPESIRAWLEQHRLPTATVATADELMSAALRSRPRLAIIDARTHPVAGLKGCQRLKADSFTGIVPALVLVRNDPTSFAAAFDVLADEVIREGTDIAEVSLRVAALLRRSDRDTYVHPSTRLPGGIEIETEIARRLEGEHLFAACYADLDHFKEYNDRYSYYDGDRVIRILSKILHDVVKGTVSERGFVGHIGGDDFLFVIPVEAVQEVCSEIVSVFDAIVPYQYSEQDRRAGYYFGKDRRGQLHKVPLMTVSIGVVTNERRHFTHPSQVSELATEMKSYAKSLPGSVFTIDRRGDVATDDDEPRASVHNAASVLEEK
jgi:diguanylate cyclase (GGDEF)-like protein